MLRLVLLVLYLAAQSFAPIEGGGGWDPDGLAAQPPPPVEIGGGLDPDGAQVPPAEIGGGWDPNG